MKPKYHIEKIVSERSVIYRRGAKIKKSLPFNISLKKKGDKWFDSKKGMWRQDYIYWIFKVVKIKYRINFI